MIGRLSGKVLEKSHEGALIDVRGVGYDVTLPLSTLASLPPTGQEVALVIHTHVREDELKLYGFASAQDRLAFRTMLKVSGVGPKLALAVIGALSGDQLAAVINSSEVARLTAIPGIGKKTAERMILELGGKLTESGGGGQKPAAPDQLAELTSALKNLGFKPAQVERAIEEIRKDEAEQEPFEVLLRQALAALQGKASRR